MSVLTERSVTSMNLCQSQPDTDWTWVSAGDREGALKRLYDRRHRRVYSICLRILGNFDEAENVTRDIFAAAYRQANQASEARSSAQWLDRQTVKTILRHLRARQSAKENQKESASPQVNEYPVNQRIPSFDQTSLEKAIAQLPLEDRVVFVLHDVERFDRREIAHLLSVDSETLRSQLHRARLTVRAFLAQGAAASRAEKTTGNGGRP